MRPQCCRMDGLCGTSAVRVVFVLCGHGRPDSWSGVLERARALCAQPGSRTARGRALAPRTSVECARVDVLAQTTRDVRWNTFMAKQ